MTIENAPIDRKENSGSTNTSETVQLICEEVKIEGEIVKCRRVDMLNEYAHAFDSAATYRKTAIVSARQAIDREKISTTQDGMENYAEPGDWIIHNPGDKDPYVFGSKNDPLEARQAQFAKKYESMPDQPGQFRAKGVIKAVQITENIVFETPWGETMAVKAGGWVADGGYGIAASSFASTYEKFDPEAEDRKKADAIRKTL